MIYEKCKPRVGAMFRFHHVLCISLVGCLVTVCTITYRYSRPFLTQSDMSVENGLFRLIIR